METPTQINSRPVWIYVLNFAALTILSLAVVIAANMALNMGFDKSSWFHNKLRADWTSNHVFTLADSSRKLVTQIDSKNQAWELAMYDPGILVASNRYVTATQVRDLLDEYAGASRMIKVRTYGAADRDELEQKIRDRFSNDIKPYNTALDHADTVLKDLKTFFIAEAAKIGSISSAQGVDPQEAELWHRMQGGLEKQAPEELEKARHEITNQLNSTLPEYSQVVGTARQAMNDVVKVLQEAFIAVPESSDFKTLSAPARAYFTDNLPKFKEELDKVQKVAQELSEDNLKPLEMDNIRSSLQPNAVIVFAPATVKIVTPADMVHTDRGNSDPNSGPATSFAGEQALSSTILTIVRPEKPKIVFVSASQANLVQGSCSDFADRLTASNFAVLEWSPASQDPANANPPAIGKGVVWVVFPPPPFDMQAMQMGQMPNTGQLVAAVRRHIELGGNALFLAEAGGRASVMPGMGDTGKYAFNDITARFGITVNSQFTIVSQQPGRNDELMTLPLVDVHTFTPNEITRPAQGARTVFYAGGNGQGGPTPLVVAKPAPADTQVNTLLTVNSSDYWATTMFSPSVPDLARSPDDYDGPLNLIASASRKTGANEQRILVVGNAQFVNDGLMLAVIPTERGLMLRFPGNGELATSSVLWLAGYENMIAVSAKAAAGARIKDLQPATVVTLDVLLILGLPIALMLLGGGIYFIRRR